jgi:carbon storage regulator
MLILTRRPGERVVIGDEILVTVMGVSGHTVRLGIAAPAGVPIYREEIWLAVREENRAAAAAAADALPEQTPSQASSQRPEQAPQTPEAASSQAPEAPPSQAPGEASAGDQAT